MNVREMLENDGIYIIFTLAMLAHEEYAYMLVERGVCHQLKVLGIDGEQAMFKKDGILVDSGWGEGVIAEGPIPFRNVRIQ